MSASFEREPNYPYSPSETFGPPPSFDLHPAYIAYAEASLMMRDLAHKDMPAATSAVAMMLFNRQLTRDMAQHIPPFMQVVEQMVNNEDLARRQDNPLATIGFEIEFPTEKAKSLVKDIDQLKYEALSDAFGLPANNNNGDDSHQKRLGFYLPTYWEVAPHFSYFHETQTRIMKELLQARFALPFQKDVLQKIDNSPDPRKALIDAIYKHVSRQGLALHLNFGIPDQTEKTLGFEADFRILGAVASIAFSSQNRLEVGGIGRHLVKPFPCEKSLKTTGGRPSRLEFRGFEVLDEQTYTTIEIMQLLTTTMFEANKEGEQDQILSQLWENMIVELFEFFPEVKHNFEKVSLGDLLNEREIVASIAVEKPQTILPLQKLLLATANQAKLHLTNKGFYPVSP